ARPGRSHPDQFLVTRFEVFRGLVSEARLSRRERTSVRGRKARTLRPMVVPAMGKFLPLERRGPDVEVGSEAPPNDPSARAIRGSAHSILGRPRNRRVLEA